MSIWTLLSGEIMFDLTQRYFKQYLWALMDTGWTCTLLPFEIVSPFHPKSFMLWKPWIRNNLWILCRSFPLNLCIHDLLFHNIICPIKVILSKIQPMSQVAQKRLVRFLIHPLTVTRPFSFAMKSTTTFILMQRLQMKASKNSKWCSSCSSS